ncbi:4Fe-4S binding domain containing protein [Trichomonas vaginalis G3]|uniref:4Fe-4S binding domain containing protein n=1 Tax=Trichomonas vaginalis (strain ATCC PRA-98 / G3) TaxID=412133 RepID=A2EVG8_TRIV3|nr:photosystem I iron-sulfur center-related family [Trichomonas vaginalis G3]EAY03354.1 4Fe-4S binding domain containing protein [Trichomonas vaginalis G3]KAI5518829.1 photosystem I iron-sulfur center-related family [Trichomonas vaginalis G3]|eukprot:XP_001315577.1 4Fe-4S binding domain containing protein [Trichomonas vaginalis G3]
MLTTATSSSSFNRFVKVIVDGVPYEAKPNERILDFFSRNHIQIPHKCQGMHECGLCRVIANGKKEFSCNTRITEGMTINTQDPGIKRSNIKKVQRMAMKDEDIANAYRMIQDPTRKQTHTDITTGSISLNHAACIDCYKCVDVCPTGALTKGNHLQTFGHFGLRDSGCVSCGACVDVCPTKAITVTDNIPVWRGAMKIKESTKVAVVDLTLCHVIEKEFGLPAGSMTYDKLAVILKNMGFQYLLDAALINDYEIVKDAARIFNHHTQGFLQTIGSFCPTMTRKLLEYPPTPAEKVVEFLTTPELDVTTFVISDFLSRRSEATFYINNPDIYLSVGVTTAEFIKILKEDKPSFDGTPCEIFPLGSAQGTSAITSERFADAVVSTFGKNYLTMRTPPLNFKKVDEGIKIAEFPVQDEITAQVAVVEGVSDVDRLYEKDYKNIIYISPNERLHPNTVSALPSIDAEASKRNIKLAHENPDAMMLWHRFLKEIDDEKWLKRKK